MRRPHPEHIRLTFRPELFEDETGVMDYQRITDLLDAARDFDLRNQAKRRRQITLTPELFTHVEVEAKKRNVHPETLVNLWICEKLHEI